MSALTGALALWEAVAMVLTYTVGGVVVLDSQYLLGVARAERRLVQLRPHSFRHRLRLKHAVMPLYIYECAWVLTLNSK